MGTRRRCAVTGFRRFARWGCTLAHTPEAELDPVSAESRKAVNPANPRLCHSYGIRKADARLAYLAVGLDPGPGFLHTDKRPRADH